MRLGVVVGSGAREIVDALDVRPSVEKMTIWSDGERMYLSSLRAPVPKPTDIPHQGFLSTVYYCTFTLNNADVYFVFLHGKNDAELPASLDQRGIFHVLAHYRVDAVVLLSASASLDTNVKLIDEGGFVVHSGIMRGFGYRSTSFPDPRKPHVAMEQPYHPAVRKLVLDALATVPGSTAYDGGVYVHSEGNAFESPQEIADIICTLDEPSFRAKVLRALDPDHPDVEVYGRLAQSLTRKHAQVGMNAMHSTVLAKEAGIERIALVSLPVYYGAGLVSHEQVNPERRHTAIDKATRDYLAPFLRAVCEKAHDYIS